MCRAQGKHKSIPSAQTWIPNPVSAKHPTPHYTWVDEQPTWGAKSALGAVGVGQLGLHRVHPGPHVTDACKPICTCSRYSVSDRQPEKKPVPAATGLTQADLSWLGPQSHPDSTASIQIAQSDNTAAASEPGSVARGCKQAKILAPVECNHSCSHTRAHTHLPLSPRACPPQRTRGTSMRWLSGAQRARVLGPPPSVKA
eukprot:1158030-Pelagomonas_calceolata.AAC.7